MKETLLQLLDYELWANKKVIQSLQETNPPPERALRVMGHILSAQQVWFNRIQGDTNQVLVWQDIQIEEMLPKAEYQYQLMKAYLSGVSDWQLVEEVSYQNSKGQSFHNTLQDILLQLSHHAAYHRGQVVELIRPLLAVAPATDYIFWVRDN